MEVWISCPILPVPVRPRPSGYGAVTGSVEALLNPMRHPRKGVSPMIMAQKRINTSLPCGLNHGGRRLNLPVRINEYPLGAERKESAGKTVRSNNRNNGRTY